MYVRDNIINGSCLAKIQFMWSNQLCLTSEHRSFVCKAESGALANEEITNGKCLGMDALLMKICKIHSFHFKEGLLAYVI